MDGSGTGDTGSQLVSFGTRAAREPGWHEGVSSGLGSGKRRAGGDPVEWGETQVSLWLETSRCVSLPGSRSYCVTCGSVGKAF